MTIYAYVAAYDNDALTIFDISDPANPTHVGAITGAGSPNYLDGASGVYVSGDYAYVASYHDPALTIFDISDPTNPIHVGAYISSGSPNYLDGAESVFIAEKIKAKIGGISLEPALGSMGII